jgi:hypothetical protein
MSVTFDRVQLIRVATKALLEHEKQKTIHAVAVRKFLVDHAREHRNTVRARRLRDYLTVELRKGGNIQKPGSDILSGGNLESVFYTPPPSWTIDKAVKAPKGLLSGSELVETRALLQVLKAATGETVSANELKLLGLKNLQPVFIAAAQQ